MSVLASCSLFIRLSFLLSVINGQENKERKVVFVLHSAFFDYSSLGWIKWTSTQNLTIKYFDVGYCASSDQATPSLQALIKSNLFDIGKSKEVLGIIGPSCSASAYAVAQLIKRSGVSVRHFHTSPLPAPLAAEVSGISVGLLPPVDLLADASVALIKYANWSQVLALYQDSDIDFNYIFTRFQILLKSEDKKNQISEDKGIKTLLTFASPFLIDLGKVLQVHPGRIFFLMLDATHVWDVLCSAYKQNIYFPTFQWVIVKTTMEDVLSVKRNNCKKQEILSVLNFAFFINFVPPTQDNGSLYDENNLYKSSIRRLLRSLNLTLHYNTFPHSNITMIDGFPNGVFIRQIQGNSSILSLIYVNKSASFVSTDLKSPYFVSSKSITVFSVISLPLGVILTCMNCLLLLICIVLHSLTIFHQKYRYMKSSSPLLLHFSYIGLYIVNIMMSMYFLQKTISIASDKVYVSMCSVFFIVSTTAVIILFGTNTVKLWRLYRIFIHYKDPGSFLSNRILILLICIFPSVDVLTCTIWYIFDPLKRGYIELNRNNLKGTTTYQAVCQSKAFPGFLAFLVTYQLIIVLVMMYFVFRLRNKIPKMHKGFRTHTLITILGYVIIFGTSFGIPGYIISHYLLRQILLEASMLGIIFLSLQGFIILLVLLPPIFPFFKPKSSVWCRPKLALPN